MIARDPYLVNFVDQFTKANNGKAFYSSLEGLGEFIFMDYKQRKGETNFSDDKLLIINENRLSHQPCRPSIHFHLVIF